MKPLTSTAPTGSGTTPKVVRKTPKKRYGNVEAAYKNSFDRCAKLEAENVQLEQIINERKIVVAPEKGGKDKVMPLNSIQLSGYTKQLSENKTELKYARKAMNKNGKVYQVASSRSAHAAKHQAKRFNERLKLSRTAIKEMDTIKAKVMGIVEALTKSKDARIEVLKNLAISDGLRFNTGFQRLFRTEVKDVLYKQMFSASGPLRSELANMVRVSFGWVKKTR